MLLVLLTYEKRGGKASTDQELLKSMCELWESILKASSTQRLSWQHATVTSIDRWRCYSLQQTTDIHYFYLSYKKGQCVPQEDAARKSYELLQYIRVFIFSFSLFDYKGRYVRN